MAFAFEVHGQEKEEDKQLPIETFIIQSGAGDIRFQLEIADTPETRRKGLMFRENLERYKGMFIDYKRSVNAGIWMKNVSFPLDIIFVDKNGKIESIASRAVPNSTETIKSVGKVRGVLEIKGGTTEKFGIKPGDYVLHAIFKNAK